MNQEFSFAKVVMLENYRDVCLKKASKFSLSFILWGCVSFKDLDEMAIITSTINAHVY